MNKILLIEDSDDSQMIVQYALRDLGELCIASNLNEARALLDKQHFDLLLIDVNLPDGSGFEFCSQLVTEKGSKRPRILFLTAHNQISDKLMGFSVGADDYLVKPFDPLELKARVRSSLRNLEESSQQGQHHTVGNLHLSLTTLTAELVIGTEIQNLEFTPTEFKLLYSLAKHEGHVFSRDQLLNSLSEGRVHVLDRTIDSHISRTRKKLLACTHNVESLYGIGYRFVRKVA